MIFTPTYRASKKIKTGYLEKKSVNSGDNISLPELNNSSYNLYSTNNTKLVDTEEVSLTLLNKLAFVPDPLILRAGNYSKEELDYLADNFNLQLDSAFLNSGLVKDFQYKNTVHIGDNWQYQFIFQENLKGSFQISLGDQLLDSGSFSSSFSIAEIAKTAGTFNYLLKIRTNDNQLLEQELPILVLDKPMLKIAFYLDQLNFDYTVLKQFLAKEGHELTAQVKVSAGLYKKESINTARNTDFVQNLQESDLIIMDAAYYRQLKAVNINKLSQSIKDSALSLVILPDEQFFNERHSVLQETWWTKSDQRNEVYEELRPVRPITNEFQIVDKGALIQQEVIGKVIVPLFRNSYVDQMQGDSIRYRDKWLSILAHLPSYSTQTTFNPLKSKYAHIPIKREVSEHDPGGTIATHPDSYLAFQSIYLDKEIDSTLSLSNKSVGDTLPGLFDAFTYAGLLKTYNSRIGWNQPGIEDENQYFQKSLNKWYVFMLLLIILTLLWIKEKW